MEFVRTSLKESISIEKLISFHYFEYAKGYEFDGEQHDFWEFLYVDKGEVDVQADDRSLKLRQGNMIFHKPDEFHTVRVNQEHKPPNLIVISFECLSPAMDYFHNKVIALKDRERNLLSSILQEGFQTFYPPFDNPAIHHLERNPNAPFASEQVIKSFLEILLINLIRDNEDNAGRQTTTKLSSAQKEKAEQQAVQQIIDYMKQHMSSSLSLDEICRAFHLGKSRLKDMFQSQLGSGVVEYFKHLKVEEAKTLIREQKYNVTEISAILGYGSIHYFSREFKKMTGMSPSEYAKTAKARIHS
ncbi:AraC family transcriptional regulator [Paenibacillus sp. N3.4]|uniref:helix-turn-helix domain-containing protein n=1 Tax=Paenibacillus sp. N3.4 TaxID=2603222 RepID=UPI00164FF07C|nr:AraC family transcriptional regulator [Paenibacillus sp. N3.4]